MKQGLDQDGQGCVLGLDGHMYAMFDFEAKVGYGKSGFPAPRKYSGWTHIGSIDAVMALIAQ